MKLPKCRALARPRLVLTVADRRLIALVQVGR
jgi:hypothetical protein